MSGIISMIGINGISCRWLKKLSLLKKNKKEIRTFKVNKKSSNSI